MKLKKIASLALAGVMAVSMLAGCKGNNSSNAGDQGTVVVPTASDIVSALNNGQTAGNEVKISFTSNSKLDEYLKAVVDSKAKMGDTALDNEMVKYIPAKAWNQASGTAVNGNNFYGDSATGRSDVNSVPFTKSIASANAVEKVQPVVVLKSYVLNSTDVVSKEAAVKSFVEKLDAELAKLKADDVQYVANKGNYVAGTFGYALDTTNKYYHTYSYTGNVSMVSETNSDGTVTYYAVVVITQTVTRQEYKG